MHGFLLHTAVASQVQLEIFVEVLVKAFQGHILRFLFGLYESLQVLVGTGVTIITPLLTVHSDPFLEIFVMLSKESQQGQFLFTDAQHGILDQLSRNKSQTVFNPFIMSLYLFGQVIYGTDHGEGVLAPAVGISRYGIPQGGID